MADIGMTVGLIQALTPKIDPETITGAVDDWLEDHPEATTTVEDGAITKAKLHADLAGEINDIENVVYDGKTSVTCSDSGYWTKNASNEAALSTYGNFTNAKIKLTPNVTSISVKIKSLTGISSAVIFVGYIDADNKVILKNDYLVSTQTLKRPQNAVYALFSYFGDSFSEDYYINYGEYVGANYDGMSGVAFGTSLTYKALTSYGYLQYLPALSGITFDNQGIGSSVILGDGGNYDMLAAIKAYTGYSGKRVCLLEGFVNDWYSPKTLGSYTDTGETTVCGCVRSAINYMLSQNANLTIFLILDHYGRNYGNLDCSSTVQRGGKTQYEYYEEIAKVAESMGIPVIKQYAGSQISENTPQYLNDNIHPNALGARQSANYIWSVMKQHYPNEISG